MQSRSRLWKELAASGSARLETSITIGERDYTPASVVTVDRAAMSTALSAGACITATVRLSLRPASGVEIPRTAAAVVRCRFTDGLRVSEWLSMGTFYVSRRQSNPVNGVLEFQGFDAMAKADAPFSLLSGYPRSMRGVVMDIARSMEIEIDARTWDVLLTGFHYSVQLPSESEKMIDVLGYIGGTCGGNWVITPANKLRLVPFVSSSGAVTALDKVEIRGITGQIRTGEVLTVTGVSSSFGSKFFFAGDDTGGIISVPANPYMHNSIASRILTTYEGLVYTPYEIKDGIYDPALEIGDYLISRSDVQGVVWQETANYKPAFRGDLSAPFPKETGDTERSLSDVGGESSGVNEELSVRFYKFVNRSAVTIADGQSANVIDFDFAAGAGQDVVFHAEIKHTTATTETGSDADGWTVGDALITVTYYINGKAVADYQPVKTETDGVNLLHLNYHFENGEFTTGNFRAVISVSGGSVSIAAGDAQAYIIGQGYTDPVGEWVTEDGLVFIGVENYPAKMEYQSGDALDYTGLIVKAYYADGTEKDVTRDCTISPAAGEAVGDVETVTVQISYTEDEKEYRDSFDVWVIRKMILYLDVRTLPAKTEYEAGETLDYTGLSVMAVYSDGTETDVTADCVFDPANGAPVPE